MAPPTWDMCLVEESDRKTTFTPQRMYYRGVVGYRQGRRESADYLQELEYKDDVWTFGIEDNEAVVCCVNRARARPPALKLR